MKILIARVGGDLFAAGSGAEAEEIITSAAEELLDSSSPPLIINEASPSEVTKLPSTIMMGDGDWVVWFTKTGTDPSGNPENIEVCVRRHPNDWQEATYKLSDVSGLHWDYVSGGVGRRTSHDTLFGYVWCDGAIDGEVAHSCRHGSGPHRIKVSLPKGVNKDNWSTIAEIAPDRT